MNVVLVTVDCLRRDRCGTYGHHRDTTPTLDALGREGYVFDSAYATGPVTTESFPGILAGRLSADCVAGENLYQKRIPEGEPTLASHLRDAGWSTAAVISNPRIGTHVDSDRGFETFRNLRTNGESSSDDEERGLLPSLQVGERLYQLRERMRKFDRIPYRYVLPFLGFRYYQHLTGWPSVRGETVVDAFLDELAGLSSPFFAWTHLMDVHGPIHPRTVADGGLVDAGTLAQFRSHAKRVGNARDPQTEARYDSAVRYVDEQLRGIVNWLKARGVWDETALVVTADHGDALFDRGLYGHPQHYTYEELLSVPLVVRVPDSDGERIDGLFSLGWLHELVAEMGEVSSMDAPLSSGRESHFSSGGESDVVADSISHSGHSIVVWRGSRKYVRQTHDLKEASEIGVGTPGLYKLAEDPKERVPQDEVVAGLKQVANGVEIDTLEELHSRNPSSTVSAETKDRLKQLGYAE